MDRSEDERRPAQRAGDQSESEGSRAVGPAQRERDNRKRERRGHRPRRFCNLELREFQWWTLYFLDRVWYNVST